MDEALQRAVRWRELGRKVAVATVVATRRSAPRPVGSKLFVSEEGELEGSVSGGCVESDVVLAAQDVLAGGPPRLLTYGITDEMAFGIGLPCGGEIDVFVEELTEAERPDVTLIVVASLAVTALATEPDSRFTLLYGNRDSQSVIFLEELARRREIGKRLRHPALGSEIEPQVRDGV